MNKKEASARQVPPPDPPEDASLPDLDWGQLAPYLSMRLFELEPPKTDWTKKTVDLARELADQLGELVLHYPPSRSKGRSGPAPGAPVNPPKRLEPRFFDLSSGLKDHKGLDDAGKIPRLSKKLPLPLLFLVGVFYRVSGPPPWLHRSPQSPLSDIKHQLILLAMMPPYIGVTSTHPPMHKIITAFIEEGRSRDLSLSQPATIVSDELLERAFVNGEAYHLWLAGLHRSVRSKPDKKTLTGTDLRYALDPFAEQTYAYNAVVSRLADLPDERLPVRQSEETKRIQHSVGFSRRKSVVWTAKSPGIIEFGRRFAHFRRLLEEARDEIRKEPEGRSLEAVPARRQELLGLNYLSRPVAASSLAEAEGPFEVALDLGDPDESGATPSDEDDPLEEWRAHGSLEFCAENDSGLPDKPPESAAKEEDADRLESRYLPIKALYDGRPFAHLWLEIAAGTNDELTVTPASMRPMGDALSRGYFEVLDELLPDPGTATELFVVRYQSGHVLNGKRLYKPEYQDVLFKTSFWTFLKLRYRRRAFEASQEKPREWDTLQRRRGKLVERIQKGTSLFAYVACRARRLFKPNDKNEWHLLCHDKANEVADFVYIEPAARRVVLVHVKGANKASTSGGEGEIPRASPNRKVSIDAYQIVLQQAVKNLRHLDPGRLADRILGTSDEDNEDGYRECGQFRVSSKDPSKVHLDCAPFARALRKLSRDTRPLSKKEVVVLQPHVRYHLWHELEQKFLGGDVDPRSRALQPAFMLSSLLIETEIACRKLGVDFEVWGEDDR